MVEIWRAVSRYEGIYSVSNLGRVKSVRNGRIMRHVLGSDGYPTVKLCRAGTQTRFRVHRLVCQEFNGPAPSPDMDAAHLDGDRLNPAAANLAWTSRAENMAHKWLHGTQQAGEGGAGSKLTDADVAALRHDAAADPRLTFTELGARYGVHRTQAMRIVKRHQWSGRPRHEHATREAGDAQ